MTRSLLLISALFILMAPGARAHTAPTDSAIDIALLLDTSNSMDGLISQAKTQLWTIVQEFSAARRQGCTPSLRVALFEYGNTNLPAREGYIRQVVPLTDNLDELSEALFSLTTQGGDEYCGKVIDEAITRLDWSRGGGHYRAVFIAGNEPFSQGQVDYRTACGRAVDRSIVVNTIHCGSREEGIRGYWQDGAVLGHGEALNIDQDQQVRHIPCPQDPQIIKLNEELNKTYLWYGKKDFRLHNLDNQTLQDSNAMLLSPSVAVKRAITKSGKMYSNRGRDLVDTYGEAPEALAEVEEEMLPDAMQGMSPEERAAHLQEMASKRADLQQEIQKLTAEREIYLAEKAARQEKDNPESTLGGAIVQAVRAQLASAGFERP
jgi:hypothetical protein